MKIAYLTVAREEIREAAEYYAAISPELGNGHFYKSRLNGSDSMSDFILKFPNGMKFPDAVRLVFEANVADARGISQIFMRSSAFLAHLSCRSRTP